ncbi:MAG TPA: hypothetical protein VLS51_00180 [Propionibacteriaceae bacterium]|nr:hypothetical protein [Propionibacteriaceae bacterium]
MTTVEYGRKVAVVCGGPVAHAEGILRAAADFERVRAACFPGWDGEPDIYAGDPDPLGRFSIVGWYAEVPSEYVTGRKR